MLQAFYWDSYSDTKWTKLEKQVAELANYFDLVWVPQSGNCNSSLSMGYDPYYYFNQNSSFGTEAQLRSMIATFKEAGIGTIADVVINHRKNVSNWVDFPSETYNGVTYAMTSTDICKNDDGGACKTWADANGYSLSQYNDSGEDWSGMRDLDHNSSNVQTIVKAYLKYLLDDLGYYGFRYDMVKGYSASFTATYNSYAKPSFSVGECWDGSGVIKNWINGTKVNGTPTSSAFDFQFRYRIRDAINQNNWATLASSSSDTGGYPLVYQSDYRPYAVTFVENHDTEYRSSSSPQDPIKADTLAANAYMLAMPGTPCVFLKHWMKAKNDIKRMISARKLAGITNTSSYDVVASAQLYYGVKTTGTKGTLICVVGKTPTAYTAPSGYTKVCSASDYVYYLSDNVASGWAAVEEQIAAENVEVEEETYTINVYVRNENSWSNMNYYIWDSYNEQLNGGWPGKRITETVEIGGYTWYRQEVTLKVEDGYCVNFVFSTGTGSPQTVDVTNVTEDKYFVVTSTQSSGKYVVNDVTATVGIIDIVDNTPVSNAIYDLMGRRITSLPSKGIYIKNGKKYFVR